MVRLRSCLAVALACLASGAAAETPGSLGTLTLVFENDAVFSDRNYTSGLMLSFVSGDRRQPGPTRWLARRLLRAEEGDRTRFGVAVGQSIFTPEDTGHTALLPDQHPYAGWFYGGLSLLVESDDTLDTLAIEVGTVGPNALGEETQDFAHEGLGLAEPGGWNNQVRNEVAGALHYERKWRLLSDLEWRGIELDLLPNAGFSAGNRISQAAVGVLLRFGDDLHNDFGPLRIRPALVGTGLLDTRDDFGGYFYLGAQGRAVAYDIVLDGNTDGRGPRVGRRPFTADFLGGIALQLCRLQGGIGVTVRTAEFRPQTKVDVFTSMFLAVRL